MHAMKEIHSIPLSKIEKEFSLERVYVPEDYEQRLLTTPEVSRPGLALAGFFEMFEAARMQLKGFPDRNARKDIATEPLHRPIPSRALVDSRNGKGDDVLLPQHDTRTGPTR
jgi:hypothetical protein